MRRAGRPEGMPRRGPRTLLGTLAVVALVLAGGAAALGAETADRDPAYYPAGFQSPDLAQPGLAVGGLVRVLLLTLLAGGIFCVANWVFADTRLVGANRRLWSAFTIGTGLTAFAAALLVPWFSVGLPLGIVVFVGSALAYVVHRNGKVTPPLRVLTGAHWKRLTRRARGRGGGPAPQAAEPEIAFLGYDDIPRRLEADSFPQERAAREVKRIVREGIDREASAAGLIVRPQKAEVRYRVGSEMVAGGEVDRTIADEAVRAIKRLANLDPDETRKPQENRLQAVVGGRTYDLRIKTAGTVRGEQVAIGIRDQAATKLRLDDLGMTEDQTVTLKEALDQRPGLVLISGPKHSGLTTTLHACLRYVDRYINNVVAFEPRSDLTVENVEHLQVDQEDGPVAASEVRSRLHLEPDVIVFDSLYEPDVAQVLAGAAAEHALVLSVRAGDSTEALTRLGHLFGDGALLGRHLQVVVNQRLVRLLCPECKEAYRPNPEFLRKANLAAEAVDTLYRPPARTAVTDGQVEVCPRCRNHRYTGRTGLFEVMPIDEEARRLIARGALADLRTHCRTLGMRNLQEEGLRLIIDGRTSVEEVVRAIKAN